MGRLKIFCLTLILCFCTVVVEPGKKKNNEIDQEFPWKTHEISEADYRLIRGSVEDIKYFPLGVSGQKDATTPAALLYYTRRDGVTKYSPGGFILFETITDSERECPECKWNYIFLGVERGEHAHEGTGTSETFGGYPGTIFFRDSAIHVKFPNGKDYCGIHIGLPWAEAVTIERKSTLSLLKLIPGECLSRSAVLIFKNKGRIVSITIVDLYPDGRIGITDIPTSLLEGHGRALLKAGYPACFRAILGSYKN